MPNNIHMAIIWKDGRQGAPSTRSIGNTLNNRLIFQSHLAIYRLRTARSNETLISRLCSHYCMTLATHTHTDTHTHFCEFLPGHRPYPGIMGRRNNGLSEKWDATGKKCLPSRHAGIRVGV